MLKHIAVKNLRSIRDQKVEISPVTVLYGENGSGKSTLMNTLTILENIVLNPSQNVNNFFNTGYANFGGFDQVVFNHISDSQIELEIGCSCDSSTVTYGVSLAKQSGRFRIAIKEWGINAEMEVSFPYPTNQQKTIAKRIETRAGDPEGFDITVNWNGILAQAGATSEKPQAKITAQKLVSMLNCPAELIRRSDFIHLKRGFSKPHYATVSVAPIVFTEDEVATLLGNDQYLEGKVSHYLERIFRRDLRVRPTPGTSIFWLNTTDKETGLSTELVNDGSGINQVVYLLAKSLRRDISTVCIEEPEIHLHPKALRNLAYAFVKLAKEEGKTMIISTHSEHLVLSLLGAVSKKQIKPEELSCYLCTKVRGESRFEQQPVNAKGQVEGGLGSFMEGELEDLKDILNVSN